MPYLIYNRAPHLSIHLRTNTFSYLYCRYSTRLGNPNHSRVIGFFVRISSLVQKLRNLCAFTRTGFAAYDSH